MKMNFSKFLLRVLALMVLVAVPGVAHAGVASGDVNGDGKASIDDVVSLIDYLLSGDAGSIDEANADVDQDGRVSIDDVVGLIDNLLSHPQTPEPSEGDWVDLGLPSGTIWATRNVGASSPEDYGDYFAWGETEPKDYFDMDNYKWYNRGYHDYDNLTKYCTDSYYGYNGFVDYKTELDLEDDAAYIKLGSSWRMPSLEQIQELIDNCTWKWTQRNGVNGKLLTGLNGNTMFLPAAGYRVFESLVNVGSYSEYWSRTLYSDFPVHAYGLYFGFSNSNWGYNNRGLGHVVRAVRVL